MAGKKCKDIVLARAQLQLDPMDALCGSGTTQVVPTEVKGLTLCTPCQPAIGCGLPRIVESGLRMILQSRRQL